jgi:C_GCAxxG_C_C family probable redox protein
MKLEPSKVEEAVYCFNNGFTCSQAIFSTYAGLLGLTSQTALKIAEPFAMGMGWGDTCGAVTGALMVIGLKYGRTQADEPNAKDITRAKTKEFIARFTSLQLSTTCSQLLEHDVNTPEGKKMVEEKGFFRTRCPQLVRTAATILEDIL